MTARNLLATSVSLVLCWSALSLGCVGTIDDGAATEATKDPTTELGTPAPAGGPSSASDASDARDARKGTDPDAKSGVTDGAASDAGATPGTDAGADGATADAGGASDGTATGVDSGKSDDGGSTTKPDSTPTDTGPGVDAVVAAGKSSTRAVEKQLGTTDAPNGFYEYLPPGYAKTGGAGSPLLVFWHGLGEDGNGTSELEKVTVNGPPKLIKNDTWPNSRPFVVLSPQNASGCPSAGSIKAFLEWSLAHYNVDHQRIYLTGLSCGAIGSWSYLQAEGSTTPIAAAVLIAGTGNGAWDTHKCELGRIAIWAFHGDADGTVAPSGTTYPMTNLLACPSPPRRDAQMTIYPGVGHDSWSRTYDLSAGHDVYQWMLDNHL